MPEDQIDTTNDCFVGVQGDTITILNPRPRMPKDVALRMAAFLVALADPSPDHAEFRKVLAAVENS